VNGGSYAIYTPELAPLPTTRLRKRVGDLQTQRDAIVRALEFLFHGI
jgi:hypothetical protein